MMPGPSGLKKERVRVGAGRWIISGFGGIGGELAGDPCVDGVAVGAVSEDFVETGGEGGAVEVIGEREGPEEERGFAAWGGGEGRAGVVWIEGAHEGEGFGRGVAKVDPLGEDGGAAVGGKVRELEEDSAEEAAGEALIIDGVDADEGFRGKLDDGEVAAGDADGVGEDLGGEGLFVRAASGEDGERFGESGVGEEGEGGRPCGEEGESEAPVGGGGEGGFGPAGGEIREERGGGWVGGGGGGGPVCGEVPAAGGIGDGGGEPCEGIGLEGG
jgi:hypothetical protein